MTGLLALGVDIGSTNTKGVLAEIRPTGHDEAAVVERAGAARAFQEAGVPVGRADSVGTAEAALDNPAWVEIKSRVTPDRRRWVTTAEPVATGAAILTVAWAGLLGQDPGRPARRRCPRATRPYGGAHRPQHSRPHGRRLRRLRVGAATQGER